jgi:hypothetical protein
MTTKKGFFNPILYVQLMHQNTKVLIIAEKNVEFKLEFESTQILNQVVQ